MTFLIILHYLFINLLGIHRLPNIIKYNEVEYFNICYKPYEKNVWVVSYAKFIDWDKTDNLVSRESKSQTTAFLKMLLFLWKWRRKLVFYIDYY